MSVIIITGSGGLVGSEAVNFFQERGFDVVGIDNNSRRNYFGEIGSVDKSIEKLKKLSRYTHVDIDIRDENELRKIFKRYSKKIQIIIHAAAQPSHELSAKRLNLDFEVNTFGTINLLNLTREYSPESKFVFMSTNKVYGDRVNSLPTEEHETRYELSKSHPLFNGINEAMSIDQSTHSPFGVSKLSADIYAQEFGKYFGLNTIILRPGCLTGGHQASSEPHGYLSYLVKSAILGRQYHLYGYNGKQVRDNLHSSDLISAIWEICNTKYTIGSVYNLGGGRESSMSLIEVIRILEEKFNLSLKYDINNTHRVGDHRWWITDTQKFKNDFPAWQIKKSKLQMINEIIELHQGESCSQ